MRGKAPAQTLTGSASRITPACAGKRSKTTSTFSLLRDHPRVCGEKRVFATSFAEIPGSPPRVRGKESSCIEMMPPRGITPAYAGKRQWQHNQDLGVGDHPRVCGEKCNRYCAPLASLGSPPRVRGKVRHARIDCAGLGITPACAGKRRKQSIGRSWRRDHPRVCGEKRMDDGSRKYIEGSPPRVRGKVTKYVCKPQGVGITPAYAGKRRKAK